MLQYIRTTLIYNVSCLLLNSEVVSMEVEQAHFDEFFEVTCTLNSIHTYICVVYIMVQM